MALRNLSQRVPALVLRQAASHGRVLPLLTQQRHRHGSSSSGFAIGVGVAGAASAAILAADTVRCEGADKSKEDTIRVDAASGEVSFIWADKASGVRTALVYDKAGKFLRKDTDDAIDGGSGSGAAPKTAAPAVVVEDLKFTASELQTLTNTESVVKDIEARVCKAGIVKAGDGMSGFPYFSDSNTSLIKKHLTPEIYLEVKDRITSGGYTLDMAIQSGVDNQDSGVGLYAGDEECYAVFGPLFDALIEDYHGGFKPTDKHVSDMDSTKLTGHADPDGKFVNSTRIRVGRNIRGFGLSPGISRADRRAVEKIVTEAVASMPGDLAGTYYSLANMSESDRKQLVADHFLFKKGDRFLQSAGANRDWPESRGIFHNKEKTFLVWINEEDQMRIISMQKGGDAKEVFERLSRGIAAIEGKLKEAGYEFSHNDHLGYIHSCPTNCGTGMRASVHAKLPNVGKHPDFKKWCAKLRLQPRGIHGEHSESDGGVYDLSNKERLGKSEVELVQTMIDGVTVLIQAEKDLAAGKKPSI